MENSYIKEIEEYYGNAIDVISDFQGTGFWFSKVEDNRNFDDKIFLNFGDSIKMQLPKTLEKKLTNKQKNEIAIDLLAYMVKKYKRGYTKRTITEVNENYLEVIDEIFMNSVRNNQDEILALMKSKKCTFDDAVLQFYDQKTKEYFAANQNQKENQSNKEIGKDTRETDER